MKATRMSVLSSLIRKNRWQIGAELGVWQGALSAHVLRNHPDLYLFGVDHWQAIGVYATKDMKAAERMALSIYLENAGRCRIIEKSTVEAAKEFERGQLDFVFIDASHDTKSVGDDIEAWYSKVRRGGYLTGHDANLASVQAALDAYLPGWSRLEANVWICPCT